MLHEDSKRIAIALITDENDKVLMGKRNDTDKWTVPAGNVEKGECPFMGMARELKEETGLDIKNIKLVDSEIKGDMLLYLFKVEVDEDQEVDTSNDPDNECDDFTYEDPFDHIEELHVPAGDNLALKYWAHN
jgi:8-oxo-dGTP pyrophosphatase MutT (NUDIX family)